MEYVMNFPKHIFTYSIYLKHTYPHIYTYSIYFQTDIHSVHTYSISIIPFKPHMQKLAGTLKCSVTPRPLLPSVPKETLSSMNILTLYWCFSSTYAQHTSTERRYYCNICQLLWSTWHIINCDSEKHKMNHNCEHGSFLMFRHGDHLTYLHRIDKVIGEQVTMSND